MAMKDRYAGRPVQRTTQVHKDWFLPNVPVSGSPLATSMQHALNRDDMINMRDDVMAAYRYLLESVVTILNNKMDNVNVLRGALMTAIMASVNLFVRWIILHMQREFDVGDFVQHGATNSTWWAHADV